ncbi:hypothetical protein [Streptomyces sp. NPDC048663]
MSGAEEHLADLQVQSLDAPAVAGWIADDGARSFGDPLDLAFAGVGG